MALFLFCVAPRPTAFGGQRHLLNMSFAGRFRIRRINQSGRPLGYASKSNMPVAYYSEGNGRRAIFLPRLEVAG